MPQAVKARADIEVSCYGYEGIDAVKSALQAGMGLSNENGQQVKINLITPPQYVLTTQSLDKESGLGMLQQAIDEIEKSIKAQGGGFNVIQAVSTGLDFALFAVLFFCRRHLRSRFCNFICCDLLAISICLTSVSSLCIANVRRTFCDCF